MKDRAQAASLLSRAAEAHRAGRIREASALYDQVLAHDPDDVDALQYGGMAQLQLGEPEAAVNRLRKAALLAPDDAPVHMLLGNAYVSLDQPEAAVPGFERAIELDPDDAQAHQNLGVALNALDRLDEAAAAFRRAIDLKPDYAQAHSNLALALQILKRYDEAIESARRATELQPDFTEAYRNLGNALYEAGRLDEAATAYQRGLSLEPAYEPMRQALITALMFMGAHRQALAACDEGLAITPGRAMLLAYKGVVLDHLGDREAANRLADLDRLVWTTAIAVPDGFRDLDEFNRSLEEHALARGNMVVETGGAYGRYNKATRDGGFVRGLHNEPKGPIAAFERIILDAMEDYLASLDTEPDHPFLAARPTRWWLDIWGNFLGEKGNLTTHHHPAGWLSGVYYSRVPASVSETDPTHGGWIEFGRPHPSIPEPPAQRLRLIRPEVGKLILFPSFVFHRTIPNPSEEDRISFAFDMCPVGEA